MGGATSPLHVRAFVVCLQAVLPSPLKPKNAFSYRVEECRLYKKKLLQKIQFILHKEHILCPLQMSMVYICLGKYEIF